MSCKNILYNNLFNRINIAHKNINDIVLRTPLEYNTRLSNIYNCDVFLKREDLQKVRSFKIRGAYNKINNLNNEQKINGVVCASAGNHAQGVAYICREKDIIGDIFLPNSTPIQKINRIKYFSNNKTKIHITGNNFDETLKRSLEFCEKNNKSFIHPYDNIETIIGQATIGKEIYEQLNYSMPDVIISGIGGGGLISGIITVFKELSPKTKIIGVEAEGAPAMSKSLKDGKIIKLDSIDNFVDGVSIKKIGKIPFDICKNYLDEILLVPEGKICQTILDLYNKDGIVVEPAGAIGISALELNNKMFIDKNVGVLICGGNNDFTRMAEIRERALFYSNLKHYFIVKFPQRAGALKEFVNNVLGKNDDITFFEYVKKNNRENGTAIVGIELKFSKDLNDLVKKMKENGFFGEYLNEKPETLRFLI